MASNFSDLLAQRLGADGAGLPAAEDPLAQLTSLLGSGKSGPSALNALATMSPELARAAAAAKRPSGVKLTPKTERAIAWARKLMGRQDWNNLCERFVEEAYGIKNVFPTAVDASRRLVTHRGKLSWTEAPIGALLYFAADETNDHNGHAAIYLGNGRMISATPGGVREDQVDSPYYADRFVGWAEPTRFPGRRSSSTEEQVPAGTPASLVDIPQAAARTVTARSDSAGLLPPALPRPGSVGSRPAPSASRAPAAGLPAAAPVAAPRTQAVTRPTPSLPPIAMAAPLAPLAQAAAPAAAAPVAGGAPTAPRPMPSPLAPLSLGGNVSTTG